MLHVYTVGHRKEVEFNKLCMVDIDYERDN